MRLRALWLQVHKWIGISLFILIIPISVTGAALVWHDWLDEQINPQRYAVSSSEARLGPGAYADAARGAAGADQRLTMLRYPEGGEGPVVANFTQAQGAGRGSPARLSIWIDPGTGQVLDAADANAGLVRVFHNLHGNLLVPGGWGRAAVGWVGAFMFISCLTGLWLWWPITGSFRRGFRWKRQNSTNANIHHQIGFWIALPLAMLSFTGVWISAPAMFGTQPPRPAPPRALERTALTPDAALAAARPLARNGRLANITWPTDKSPEWKIGFEGAGEVAVNDATGAASAPQRAGGGGPQRSLMRRWHDGTGMGPVWQIAIFIGGIIPAILAVTGIVMWLRSRGWRRKLAQKRKARGGAMGEAAPQPAE
jgi:uncharacterized iron-regulated membrane protein